jgi:hypothetical protein
VHRRGEFDPHPRRSLITKRDLIDCPRLNHGDGGRLRLELLLLETEPRISCVRKLKQIQW